jgi:hypothetical protein
MTLQVAMIASDGWLLASDLAGTEPVPTIVDGQGQPSVAGVRSAEPKIVRVERHSLIYAFAGTGSAKSSGALLGTIADGNPAAVVNDRMSFLCAVQQEAKTKYGNPVMGPDGTLTILFLKPKAELWTLHLARCNIIGPRLDPPCAVAGAGNWAMFLPCRYYEPRPLADLKLLAAHTILTGNYFNPTGVAGLQLWSAKHGEEPEEADEAEIRDLEKRSALLSDSLRTAIFPERP